MPPLWDRAGAGDVRVRGAATTGPISSRAASTNTGVQQLCDPDRQGDPALNAIRLASTDATSLAGRLNPQRWIHGTFHPKKAGHQLMADALYAWLYAEHPELIPGGAAPPAVDEPPCQKDTCRAFVDKWIITTAAAVLRALLLPTLGVLAGSWLAAVGVVAFGRRRDPAAPVTAS